MKSSIKVLLFFALIIVFSCAQDETNIISDNDNVIMSLEQWLADPADQRTPIEEQNFALDSLGEHCYASSLILVTYRDVAEHIQDSLGVPRKSNL